MSYDDDYGDEKGFKLDGDDEAEIGEPLDEEIGLGFGPEVDDDDDDPDRRYT